MKRWSIKRSMLNKLDGNVLTVLRRIRIPQILANILSIADLTKEKDKKEVTRIFTKQLKVKRNRDIVKIAE